MGKGLETGTAYFRNLLNGITDPAQRQAAETLLANQTFLTQLGDGVEGQSEISRQLAQLRTQTETLTAQAADLETREQKMAEYYTSLNTWYSENKALIDAGRAAKTPAPTVPTPTPTPTTPAPLTLDQYQELMRSERADFLGFTRDQNLLMERHFNTFGKFLNIEPLLTHPEIAKIGLTGVYELVHKDALATHASEQQRKHDEAIAAEAVRKDREARAQMPYLTPDGVGSGSPLDAIKPAAAEPVVDAAVSHYNRLQAERAAAGAH